MRGLRLATVALLGAFLAVAAPGSALAADSPVRLGLTPIGQPGPYFDLVMRPGEVRTLKVDIANDGAAAIAARTYAADVYTIVDGGFGARLRGAPQTGATLWLDYRTEVLRLPAGRTVPRTFSVTVPATTRPGEYITSLILENDQPVAGDGPVSLDQVIRQAVAVVITVPGSRVPALAVGGASYKLVAEAPVVVVAVSNTGNVRLKPIVTFSLSDGMGTRIQESSLLMETFYSHDGTFVEMGLTQPLAPGAYSVRLTLDDPAQQTRTDRSGIALDVPAPPPPAGPGPGILATIQAIADGSTPLPIWVVLLLGCVALAVAVGLSARVARRRRTARIGRR